MYTLLINVFDICVMFTYENGSSVLMVETHYIVIDIKTDREGMGEKEGTHSEKCYKNSHTR